MDPLPLQQPDLFIIHHHTTNTHTEVRAHIAFTFIIYCGNVLNAWLNTATQIYPEKAQGMGKSGLGSHMKKRTD